jgi:thiamine biosynthesis protein ThiS
MIKITVNGEIKNADAPMTVAELLRSLGIKPASVAVERNLKIVARTDFETEPVEEGDAIEIIRLVGGG